MKIVERILAVIVGQEMSLEELAEVSGGKPNADCPAGSMLTTNGCKQMG